MGRASSCHNRVCLGTDKCWTGRRGEKRTFEGVAGVILGKNCCYIREEVVTEVEPDVMIYMQMWRGSSRSGRGSYVSTREEETGVGKGDGSGDMICLLGSLDDHLSGREEGGEQKGVGGVMSPVVGCSL